MSTAGGQAVTGAPPDAVSRARLLRASSQPLGVDRVQAVVLAYESGLVRAGERKA